jgi:hypothetical protein
MHDKTTIYRWTDGTETNCPSVGARNVSFSATECSMEGTGLSLWLHYGKLMES